MARKTPIARATYCSHCGKHIQSDGDPRLLEAKKNYDEGERLAKKAIHKLNSDYQMRFNARRRTKEMFKQAEDYFHKAALLYEEAGKKHDIDVSEEVKQCNKRERKMRLIRTKCRQRTGDF